MLRSTRVSLRLELPLRKVNWGTFRDERELFIINSRSVETSLVRIDSWKACDDDKIMAGDGNVGHALTTFDACCEGMEKLFHSANLIILILLTFKVLDDYFGTQ